MKKLITCLAWLGLLCLSATAAESMAVGKITTQPIGHYEFCKAHPAECTSVRASPPAAFTQAGWREIRRINQEVNQRVQPANDIDIYKRDEWWAYPTKGAGDCEDYVLEKRLRLHRELGISFSNLLITVVRRPNGEGHAVLTLRTKEGDFILDNLSRKILRWDATGYKYLKRQASGHAGLWVSLNEAQTPRYLAANTR